MMYFEAAEDGTVERQYEVFENGCVLIYDRDHPVDEFSWLTDDPMLPSETDEELVEISEAEFKRCVHNLVRRVV